MTYGISFMAVLIAAVVNMVIGMAWYSPMFFGKAWMKMSGLSEEKMRQMKAKGMGKTYLTAFVSSLVMAYVLAHFVGVWNAAGFFGAWQLAFWIWLGFIVTSMLGSVLWEGRPVKLYALNVFYYLVTFFAMALVLTFWR